MNTTKKKHEHTEADMTDEELIAAMQEDTPLNRARQVFSGEVGRIEQAYQQRVPPTPIDHRRMEFEAVRKIAAELGADLSQKRGRKDHENQIQARSGDCDDA